MPILGIMASAISGNLSPASDFYSIQSALASGSTTTISFTGIPDTYRHLQLRTWASSSTLNADIFVQFNGDSSSSNYNSIWFGANGSNTPTASNSSTTGIYYGLNATADGYPWSAIMEIQDYKNTGNFKQAIVNSGSSRNDTSTGTVYHTGGHWKSTTAINRVDIVCSNNFSSGSMFALYGWK